MRGLGKEGGEDLLYILALALGTVGTLLAVLCQWLDSVEHVMAGAAAILVSGHANLPIDLGILTGMIPRQRGDQPKL
jgi:hypothetical protein